MYVVLKNGKKLPVDTSSLNSEDQFYVGQNVGIYSEDTILKPLWILELNKSAYYRGVGDPSRKDTPLDFIAEVRYDHEPTEEEILWAMSMYGLNMNDVAIVRKGFELDFAEENE